jgi:hypothetical protein
MFNIGTGVAKDFSPGEQRRLEFTWEAFNATNSVRYDTPENCCMLCVGTFGALSRLQISYEACSARKPKVPLSTHVSICSTAKFRYHCMAR